MIVKYFQYQLNKVYQHGKIRIVSLKGTSRVTVLKSLKSNSTATCIYKIVEKNKVNETSHKRKTENVLKMSYLGIRNSKKLHFQIKIIIILTNIAISIAGIWGRNWKTDSVYRWDEDQQCFVEHCGASWSIVQFNLNGGTYELCVVSDYLMRSFNTV